MLKRIFLLFLLILWAVPLFAQSVDTAWVRRYNGPGSGWDETYAMAVDGSGNVFVTGWSEGDGTGYDYAIIKYYPNGDTAWVRRHNGPRNSLDRSLDIAIDNFGNVYVTGYTSGDGTGIDWTTIKYDSSGNESWVEHYNGSGNWDDYAVAITVDDSDAVYVTGSSYAYLSGNDFTTIKYDTSGNQLWLKRYNGLQSRNDAAMDIARDASSNIYVTGYSFSDATLEDYVTIKYDRNGNELWVRAYDGPENWNDYASAVAIDKFNNIYVTGNSYGLHFDYATVKYDSSGNELWVRRYNGTGDSLDIPYAVDVDDSGNVYVTGSSYGVGKNTDCVTIKYNSFGDEIWVRRYSGPGNSFDFTHRITTDCNRNAYVAGASRGSGTPTDVLILKYDELGNQVWGRQYNGPADKWDWANAINVDGYGNVYLTGASYGNGTDYDYLTIKYVQFLRGDVNQDNETNVVDVVYLTNYLFKSGSAPSPISQVGDVNCDDMVDITDVIYLIDYIFRCGSAPCI